MGRYVAMPLEWVNQCIPFEGRLGSSVLGARFELYVVLTLLIQAVNLSWQHMPSR
jgi:hypothetical protein